MCVCCLGDLVPPAEPTAAEAGRPPLFRVTWGNGYAGKWAVPRERWWVVAFSPRPSGRVLVTDGDRCTRGQGQALTALDGAGLIRGLFSQKNASLFGSSQPARRD